MEAAALEKSNPRHLDSNEALFQIQRLAGIGTLTASVAHELTNPISVITATCNNIQLLAAENDLTPQDLRRFLEMIDHSAWRCIRLIEMLRHYTHSEDSEFVWSNLNRIIEDSLTLVGYQFQREYNISIVTNLKPNLPSIYCDRNQITQVLINLLTNAKDALPSSGGKIWIQSSHDRDSHSCVVTIKDNGSGMEDHVVDRIFDPFFTTKAPGEGTGLGLAIASQIVELHQGEITVETNLDVGSTFTIELPIEQASWIQKGLL